MSYDVVIIGSGLGGLECGAILSREGYRVCVLEKNHNTGGCLQTFRRDRHLLDTGIHYVGSLDRGQILNQYFRYLGVMDRLDVVRMDEGGFDTVVLDGCEYPLGMGYGRYADNLKERFPAEATNIDRFCGLLQSIGGTMSMKGLSRGVISDGAMRFIETSAHRTIEESFSDPTLRKVVAGTSLLYGGARDKTTLYHYGMINHSFIESAWRFVGGSQQLADLLAANIRANGGYVMTDMRVTKICNRGDRVTGVEVGTEFIEARYVISDIHPEATFSMVEKTPFVKKAYLSRLRSLENSPGTFSVCLAMKKGAVPYRNRNFYIHGDGGDPWDIAYDIRRDTPRAVLLSMQAGEHDQKHAGVVSLLCAVPFEMFARWTDTLPERRGENYLELKTRLADRIIDFVDRRFPGLRGGIESVYTTSPLSYRDYTASPRGSSYGIVKDYGSALTTLIPVSTRFENLLMTGQNLNVHGALGVTVTAALTCSRLLGVEYIAKQISKA